MQQAKDCIVVSIAYRVLPCWLKAPAHYMTRDWMTLRLTSSHATDTHTTQAKCWVLRLAHALFFYHSKCVIEVHNQSWRFDLPNPHEWTHESVTWLENLCAWWCHACVTIQVAESCDRELVCRGLNPILTGGGPPCMKSATASRPPEIATRLLMSFFFEILRIFDTKFVKIGPSVARSCDILYSHIGTKFAQNPHFTYVCVQNTWKLLIFLKCTKTVFILSLGPFAQFLISWNQSRSNYNKKKS